MDMPRADKDGEKLKRLLSTVTDGIVVVDMAGRVLYANDSARAIFGGRQLVGRNLGIPLAPHGAHHEIQVVRGGQVGWAELRTAPIEWDGKAAMVSSFRDITERKAAEEALRSLNAELENRVEQRTAELREANKELDSFAYSVSHDLRAPLRAIGGYARILRDSRGEHLSPEEQRYLAAIGDGVSRMGCLIDDLLEFSRMGRQELRLRAVDMTTMVGSVMEELRAAEPERAVDFLLLPLPAARGDDAMLRHVWWNLLGNAVKFTRYRDRARIEVGGRDEGTELVFWVKDNGTGFDMEHARKLFQVFQRLHRQEEFEGSGAGLAIVERIVRRHGGRVWAEAKPQAGATFSFSLPVAPQGTAQGTDTGRSAQ